MNTLYLLYDATCPASQRHIEWLMRRRAIVPLRCVPHQDAGLLARNPGLAAHLAPRELTAVSDDGHVWTGPAASVVSLFMLENYRELAERLAQPTLVPMARLALELLTREVFELTCLLRRSSAAELENLPRLNAEPLRRHFNLPPPIPPPAIATAIGQV